MKDTGGAPAASTAATATTATAAARPRSLPETVIRAYGLRELLPGYEARVKTVLTTDDVVFRSDDSSGGAEVRTFGALFSIAAAAKGRPAVAVERYGTLVEEVDGRKVIKCTRAQMEQVRAVQGIVEKEAAEMLGRLLEEAEKEKEGKIPTPPPKPASRMVVRPLKKPSPSGKSTVSTNRQSTRTVTTSPSPPSDASSTTCTKIHVHRTVITASIPYYKYLSLSTIRYSDSTSDTSTLPRPTFTPFALRVIQMWLYDPLRIGEVLEAADPHAHLFLPNNCRRQDRNGYPPPLATARGLVEVARAADYFGIEELAAWTAQVLRKLCHGLDKCTGNRCRVMVPYVLERVWEGGRLGLPTDLLDDLMRHIAAHPETMWKRPVIMLPDKLIDEIVQAFVDAHRRTRAMTSVLEITRTGQVRQKWKRNDIAGQPLVWWEAFVGVSKVRSTVSGAAGANQAHLRRWDEKLLGPAIERCVHALARTFDDSWLAEELTRKMADQDFERESVIELLMFVTMTSVAGLKDTDVPFERAPLNRRTVRAIFEGIVNLRTWDGWDNEWGIAERRVLSFLQREWMTIAVSGEAGGFNSWRPAMLTVVSRKLRVSTDDLLGKSQARKAAQRAMKGKAVMRDRLGNDVQVDTTAAAAAATAITAGNSAGSPATALRPEAPEFVPSGSE
ncbi:hypothetical protein ABW21_db0203926 [Orbilia brochopaga]|nr:hypothetical protein ABW21_db0203926 [Drechslerella brochopaga]